MRQINGVYTQKFNRIHNRVGHVFQKRFKSILVEKDAHLLELCRYIVNNPVKAGRCKSPGEWQWSSYNSTAFGKAGLELLSIDWVLRQFSPKSNRAKRKYREFVEEGLEKSISMWKDIKGQVLLGSDSFVDEMQNYLESYRNMEYIPKSQKVIGRTTLNELFPAEVLEMKESRNRAIFKAYRAYC